MCGSHCPHTSKLPLEAAPAFLAALVELGVGGSLQGRTGDLAQDPEAGFEVTDPEVFGV